MFLTIPLADIRIDFIGAKEDAERLVRDDKDSDKRDRVKVIHGQSQQIH